MGTVLILILRLADLVIKERSSSIWKFHAAKAKNKLASIDTKEKLRKLFWEAT